MTELPDDFEAFFVKLQRKAGQTLQEYQTEFGRVERRLRASQGGAAGEGQSLVVPAEEWRQPGAAPDGHDADRH